MPKKHDPRIDAYIRQAQLFAQPVLEHLRELVHRGCPDVEEDIKWSSPSFMYRGKILCGIAAFKEHATFGFWHQAMEKELGPLSRGTEAMGLLGRIRSLADLPDDKTMLRFIKRAVELHDSGAPLRPAPKAKPPAKVPPDLAAALKKDKTAAATFDKFSPSHRREYIEWIVEAKRDETRQKRLETTLEWLAEGKSRNWKYQNC
ncbi:MAG TPA: YdeI/OmpD-associated family protein [Opitutaceae bacterium]|nr:YdeI/OmpD-associated family protein [Opitutaceae bacterium]